MKRLALFALALAATLTFGAGAFAATEIKLAHVVNEKDAFHACALKFKEIVEEKTGGEIVVQLFPNATLGDERNLLESLKMGVVEMAIITGGPIINFMPQFGVFDLPFLFASPEHAYKVLDGEIGRKMLADMEKNGWKGLAYGERGFRNLTNSKRPVVTPADMTGLKIRLMQNPVFVDAFKALGANAVPMAWTEALTALQQGTIDGQENPINVIHAFNLNESQKYLTLTRHAYSPNVILFSLRKWKEFTPEQQAIMEEAAQAAAEYNRDLDNANEAAWLQELKDRGMEVVENPDLAAFREAVQPVYEKYEEKFGKDLIEAIGKVQ
ncbi:MAG: TRAP transporter substrate-binding protein [Synergistaceae bacterium]|jgi:tripartite ATP-independent transporter DctP family solute receptor|nr:TRAP transporter substrate-binding protein [Synergistaceae bacterium]